MRPAITISRMTGSGGRTIASELTEYLQGHAPVDCHWTVFDRNLIERVLEDHNLSKTLGQYIPENHKPLLGDMLEELLGLHPSSWTIVQHTSQTILRLAQMGYVVVVGRGGNIVTARLPNVFHVRLVGSPERRLERVEQVYALGRAEAFKFIRREDRGRRRYLKENFGKDIDDPSLYHLVINTDRIPYGEAARLIGDEVVHRFGLAKRVEAVAA